MYMQEFHQKLGESVLLSNLDEHARAYCIIVCKHSANKASSTLFLTTKRLSVEHYYP